MESNSAFDNFEMQVTDAAKDFLRTASGWALFLAVTGFILNGLMFLGALMMFAVGAANLPQQDLQVFSPVQMALGILLYIVVFTFPIYYLGKFASTVKKALNENSTASLTAAFSYLKSHYKTLGIAVIIGIVSYILLLIVMISKAAAIASQMQH